MRQFRTQAIILNRTDYGEADRIITFLTPDHGKVRAIAKGVRKTKSKLAGGIELFSVSDISFIPAKREISTVVSTRLITHYGQIVKDLDRTAAGYEFIKRLDKATEDAVEPAYFGLLDESFKSLDDNAINLDLIKLWFDAQLLRLSGHTPNLRTDKQNHKLDASVKYDFSFDSMTFEPSDDPRYGVDNIKFLRILFSDNLPQTLAKVKGCQNLVLTSQPLVQAMLQLYIRI
jgi:DNA repair protein RecO (recombination protein O)